MVDTGCRNGGHGVEGQQADATAGQQPEGIQVFVASAGTPVQARDRAVAFGQVPDHLPAPDPLAAIDHGRYRFVGGPQASRVLKRHQRTVDDHARVDDVTIGCRHDLLTGDRCQVDAAVPGTEGGLRWDERANDLVRRRQRPGEEHALSGRRRRHGRRGRGRRDGDQQGHDQGDELGGWAHVPRLPLRGHERQPVMIDLWTGGRLWTTGARRGRAVNGLSVRRRTLLTRPVCARGDFACQYYRST